MADADVAAVDTLEKQASERCEAGGRGIWREARVSERPLALLLPLSTCVQVELANARRQRLDEVAEANVAHIVGTDGPVGESVRRAARERVMAALRRVRAASAARGGGGGGGGSGARVALSQVLDLGLVAKEGGREALDLLPI